MKKKQIEQFNRMRAALLEISVNYATPDQLRRGRGSFGLDYQEAMEMAYENIQILAKQAVKNVRAIIPDTQKPQPSDTKPKPQEPI